MVYLFIYNSQSPQLQSSPTKWGENIWSPSAKPHLDWRPMYNWVWPGSPRGSFITLLSLPKCHAAFSMIHSTLAWVDQTPVSQHVSCSPSKGYPFHTCYPAHVTQGTNPHSPEVGTRGAGIYGRQVSSTEHHHWYKMSEMRFLIWKHCSWRNWVWIWFIWISNIGLVTSCSEHSSETSGFVKHGEFFDQLSDPELLKKGLIFMELVIIFRYDVFCLALSEVSSVPGNWSRDCSQSVA